MKKYLLLFLVLFLYKNALSAPSNTLSISPVAVDAATITASDENTRNNSIVSTYNAHDHTDISQTGNTLNVGDALAGNKTITAYNADSNKPFLRYDDTNNYWIFSTDGVAPSVVLQGTGITFEGTTDDEYETTFSITDPTADRTITIPNNAGTVILSGASSAQTINLSGDTISATSITGLTTLTASGNIDIGSYELQAQTFESDVATGTAPFIVASTTKVTNLNADTVDGITSSQLGTSNVIFNWFGSDSATTDSFGFIANATILNYDFGVYTAQYNYFGSAGTTPRTVLLGKFIKIAGISTVTINARLWSSSADGGAEAILKVDIGGQNNTVKSVTSTTPAWVTVSTIDVSSLTDGTTYDIIIQLYNETSQVCYCSAIILTGS